MTPRPPNSVRFSSSLLKLLIPLLAGVLGAPGCGDDSNPESPPEPFEPPSEVSVVNGDERIILTWVASPDETSDDFKRYNVYRGDTSLLGVVEADLLPFLVDSVTSSAKLPRLISVTNGTRWYFHVRGQQDNGRLSGPSNEVQAAGREEGIGVIWEFSSTGDNGFDFSEGQTVSLGESNPQRFETTDVYLGTTDTLDARSGNLVLKGPQLLENRDPDWANRSTGLKTIDTWETAATDDANWEDQVEVGQGTVFALLTADKHYAKIEVLIVETINQDRQITFRWAWQPTVNLALF